MNEDSRMPELTDAARHAESIVRDINSIVDVVQREADEIRRSAEEDAQATRREAEADAHTARREAMESASRVLERLDALERPLGELVQTIRGEVHKVARELEGPAAVEATAIPAAAESPAGALAPTDAVPVVEVAAEPEAQAPSEPEPALAEVTPPGESDQTKTHDTQAAQPQPQPIVHSSAGVDPQTKKNGRFRSLFRGGRGKGAFITSEGHCAVCQKTFMAGSEEKLSLSGWKVSGGVGVCPEDQADGWQLPDGARLPFRRGASDS